LRVLDVLLVIALIDSLMTIRLYYLFPSWKIATTTYLFCIAWGLFPTRWPRPMGVLCLAIALLTMFLSGRRGPIIALVVVSPLLIWYFVCGLRVFVGTMAYALLILLVVSAYYSNIMTDRGLAEKFQQRSAQVVDNIFGILFEGQGDASMEHRLEELKNVRAFFLDAPLFLVFGGGFGVETDMIYDTGVDSVTGRMHQVYVGWGAYLLRNGILGVALLGLLCRRLGSIVLKPPRAPYVAQLRICATFITLLIILSFKDQFMLEMMFLPVVIGLAIGFAEANRAVYTQRGDLPSHHYLHPKALNSLRCRMGVSPSTLT